MTVGIHRVNLTAQGARDSRTLSTPGGLALEDRALTFFNILMNWAAIVTNTNAEGQQARATASQLVAADGQAAPGLYAFRRVPEQPQRNNGGAKGGKSRPRFAAKSGARFCLYTIPLPPLPGDVCWGCQPGMCIPSPADGGATWSATLTCAHWGASEPGRLDVH